MWLLAKHCANCYYSKMMILTCFSECCHAGLQQNKLRGSPQCTIYIYSVRRLEGSNPNFIL